MTPTMTAALVLAAVLGVLVAIAIAGIADRAARETAWRRIAMERRWNQDHYRRP